MQFQWAKANWAMVEILAVWWNGRPGFGPTDFSSMTILTIEPKRPWWLPIHDRWDLQRRIWKAARRAASSSDPLKTAYIVWASTGVVFNVVLHYTTEPIVVRKKNGLFAYAVYLDSVLGTEYSIDINSTSLLRTILLGAARLCHQR